MSVNDVAFDPRQDPQQQIEDDLFEALCRVQHLPRDRALPAVALAASAIGAFLGDLARLDPSPRVAALALAQLVNLQEDCARLLDDLAERGF